MSSFYSEELESTIEEIQTNFISKMDLTVPYIKNNLAIGSTYGIIAPIAYEIGEDRRTAFQDITIRFGITLSAVYETRLEAHKKTVALQANLHHGIAAIKDSISPWSIPGTGPNDFIIEGNISCTGETTPSAPHYWQMYVIAEALMPLTIYKDILGQHSPPPL